MSYDDSWVQNDLPQSLPQQDRTIIHLTWASYQGISLDSSTSKALPCSSLAPKRLVTSMTTMLVSNQSNQCTHKVLDCQLFFDQGLMSSHLTKKKKTTSNIKTSLLQVKAGLTCTNSSPETNPRFNRI